MTKLTISGKTYQGNNKAALILIAIIDSILYKLFYPFHFYNYKKNKDLITHPKKIILIRLDNIGDVVLTTPLIKNIRQVFPYTKIDILVKDSTTPLLKNNPYIGKIIKFIPFWFARKNEKSTDLKKTWEIIKRLRKKKYDLGFELRGDLNNIIFLNLIAPKFKIGYSLKGGSFLLDLDCQTDRTHEVDKNNHLLESLLGFIKVKIPKLIRKPEIFIKDRNKKSNIFENGKFNIVIHCSSAWSYRNYPPELFAEVINKISQEKQDSFFYLRATKDESKSTRELIKNLKETTQKKTKIVENLSLEELIFFLSQADMFIGNDSGPAHIAAALGRKTIVIFGPQNPDIFGPIGNSVSIIYKKMPCSPCRQEKMKNGCPFHPATCLGLLRIKPEEIVSECFKV